MQFLPFWGGNPSVNYEPRKDFYVYATEPRQGLMRGKISFQELISTEDSLYSYSLGYGTFFCAEGTSVDLELQIYGHEFLNDQGVVGGLLRTSIIVREHMANVVFNFRRDPGPLYGFDIQEIDRRPGVISFTDRNRHFIARENLEHRLLPAFNARRRRFEDMAPEVVDDPRLNEGLVGGQKYRRCVRGITPSGRRDESSSGNQSSSRNRFSSVGYNVRCAVVEESWYRRVVQYASGARNCVTVGFKRKLINCY